MNENNDHIIESTRVVPFERSLVYKAWTNPVHLANWWGPKGFTNTFHEHDLRPGGIWDFTMHGPEKGNYPNRCVFTEIEPPSLLSWDRLSKPLFKVVARFEEVSRDQTRVIFQMIFPSVEECEKLKKFVPEKNEENFDKLEEELMRMQSTTASS